MKRYILHVVILLPILLVILPAAVVHLYSSEEKQPTAMQPKQEIVIPEERGPQINVYRSKIKQVESMPLETYIEGVLAAEMPAEFEMEALKAQALAARTYIVRRLAEGKWDDVPNGAHVLDTTKHQVYVDETERKERWGKLFEWKNERIKEAVASTKGKVLTYEDKPIDATFFSTSNGFTENAEDYWTQPIPYLRSVASPWDSESPDYLQVTSIPVTLFQQKLGVTITQAASNGSWYEITEWTKGSRIGRIVIGEKEFSGKEIREKLQLSSSAFTMKLGKGQVEITTKGYGHGVGMSQWGANGMAKAGRSAEQIVMYYYQGIALQDYRKIVSI
ncbi:stage II sporulation protein D [Brevibacillus daliensis]|uniref:stage II sporulation protein D n=1 Tax=Brevibacillus daliensis TaxID=2892995 RepID=UPI001E4A2D97|nr:stage II sporulation protein D [Brevibacillus daliensis]